VELGSKNIEEDIIAGKTKPRSARGAAVSRAAESGAKASPDQHPPFIQEVCPSAPIEIDPSGIEQIARVGRIEEHNSERASFEDNNVVPKGFDTVYARRSPGMLLTDQSNKPAIVVIDRRDFFRDCFVRCLQIAYGERTIHSFATIADWCGSAGADASSVAVIIIVTEAGQEASLTDREFIERTDGKIPIVIVSDVDDVEHIVGALKRGVRGYIPSSLPFNVAIEAVRLVEAGGVFVPASSLVDRERPAAAAKGGVALTERQMMVLEEIRHGKANKQIAYALKMSEHTVKLHLRHIMRKLNVRNRTEVAMFSESLLAQKDV
jgi:DNA-binding NarL/FixJ family response regulator